jgi:hypothetical protein
MNMNRLLTLGMYLPSKDELNKLYLSRHLIGGFSDNTYWSSTEDASGSNWNMAWAQSFNNGAQAIADRSNSLRVRAVRSF